MESQYVESAKKTSRLLQQPDCDADTCIEIEPSGELEMSDNMASSILIHAVSASRVPDRVDSAGQRIPMRKKLLAAGMLIGISLLYLVAQLVRNADPGSDDSHSDGSAAGSGAEPALPYSSMQLLFSVVTLGSMFSLMTSSLRKKEWSNAVVSFAQLTGRNDAPVYAGLGTSNQTDSTSPFTTASNFSLVPPGTSTAMSIPGMWRLPSLPPEPLSGGFADDISVAQLEADLRLIDAIRMADLEEMFDLENKAFEQKHARAHRRLDKRDLVNTENKISPVGQEINALMTTGLPEHVRTEFSMLLQMINRLEKNRSSWSATRFLMLSPSWFPWSWRV